MPLPSSERNEYFILLRVRVRVFFKFSSRVRVRVRVLLKFFSRVRVRVRVLKTVRVRVRVRVHIIFFYEYEYEYFIFTTICKSKKNYDSIKLAIENKIINQ